MLSSEQHVEGSQPKEKVYPTVARNECGRAKIEQINFCKFL